MIAVKLLFLCGAGVVAQLTTSFWMPKYNLGTERIRYLASVVDAGKGRLTLAYHPENDTDYEALGLVTGSTVTATFASTLFEYSTSNLVGADGGSAGDWAYSYKCEMQTADTEATCTISEGQGMAFGRCATRTHEGYTSTLIWTFSDTDTAGVETILWTRPGPRTTPLPEWCSVGSGTPVVPSSVLSGGGPVPRSAIGTYKFIITAGEEKVATTTGGAAPMKTMVPALAGLGAAVAVFF